MLTQEIVTRVIQQSYLLYSYIFIRELIDSCKKQLITRAEFIEHLTHNMMHLIYINFAIRELSKVDPPLDTRSNIKRLIEHAEHAADIARLVTELESAQMSMNTQENLERILNNSQHAESILQAWIQLIKGSGVATQPNFSLLLRYSEFAESIASELVARKMRGAIITQAEFNGIIAQIEQHIQQIEEEEAVAAARMIAQGVRGNSVISGLDIRVAAKIVGFFSGSEGTESQAFSYISDVTNVVEEGRSPLQMQL